MYEDQANRRKRTILHVSEAFGGGVQTAVLSYISNSRQYSHGLVVRRRPSHDIGSRPDVTIEYVTGSIPVFLWKARRQIVRLSPDVVHLHSSYAGILRLLLPRTTNIVYTPHSYAFCRTDVSKVHRAMFWVIEMMLSRRRHLIAGVSPFELHQANQLASSTVSKRYLPNVSRDEPIRRVQAAVLSQPTVVMVGRIMAQKDPEFYLEAKKASKTVARWIWIGDGDSSMRGLLESAEIEVTGWLPNSEVLERVANASLYFHCAKWEGAPVTVVEAASLDTPVLVRKISELDGLGFFPAGSNPEDAARSIDKFFEDSAFQQRVKVTTRESATVHSPTVQKTALKAIYGYIEDREYAGERL
jgi:glycosyltransferase involved in cell wall biosynthesis